MTDLERELRSVPPGTRVGAFLKRHEERQARARVNDELRIEAMGSEIGRVFDENLARMFARSELQRLEETW